MAQSKLQTRPDTSNSKNSPCDEKNIKLAAIPSTIIETQKEDKISSLDLDMEDIEDLIQPTQDKNRLSQIQL